MPEKRVTVWVQRFKDRAHLMLQWIDPDTGKRKSKSAETADDREAEQARADLEYELNHGRYQEASRMTWERFRELFEAEYLPNVRPRTRLIFDNAFDLFERICNPKALRAVTERTVSAFAAGLRKMPGHSRAGLHPNTVRTRLRFLRSALNWAVRQKLLPECPVFPVIKVPKKKPQPVPSESFERLLAKARDPEMRAFLLCGWLAGLRLKEAQALEWAQSAEAPWVDFTRNRIWLPGGFVKAAEDQWVPLDPELQAALESLPRHGRKVFRFVAKGTDRPLSQPALSCRVIALAKKAGVRLSMHTLRKGFGCRYAGKVPSQVLQKLMRHSSITLTMDYYANVDAAVEEAVLGPQRNSSRNSAPETAGPGTADGSARAGQVTTSDGSKVEG
jgi:integrase